MSKRNRQKIRESKLDIKKLRTAIALRCVDCQGYELKRNGDCGLHSCPLFSYQARCGVTKSKKFSELVSKFRKLNESGVEPDKDYWVNEFSKL